MDMETLKPNIAEHPFLKSFPPAYLGFLTECVAERVFAPGEVIFREGEIADRFFLISKGKVVLESPVPGRGFLGLQELGAGDALGWSWLFPPYVWHFQARAMEATRTLSFGGAHLLIVCEKHHDFGYELMKRLTQVLIGRLQAAHHQHGVLQPGSASASVA
jgi:CRP/FNR family transcriptional regulator, cyclic AMP receptor protein